MTVLTALFKTLPEGSRYPEKGMDSKEGKCAEQQAGHGPEGIIQVRILFPVMMRGMGQVSGKFPVGARVAFLAGLDDIAPVQACFTIVGRQNIMGPVAVGTFRRLFTSGQH